MRIVVSDWETHYNSADYTLKKMTQEEYLRDPRFQAHGCAIKWPGQPARWYDRHRVGAALKAWDWSDTLIVHHHGQFDSAIENWHYDMRPAGIACTLAMARLLLGNHISVSLDSVRAQFGIAPKLTPYHLFDGKYWDDISPADQRLIGEGACDEVESIWKIFQMLMQQFPPEELRVVSTTVKMFTEPVLIGDTVGLGKVWSDERQRKGNLLRELGITEDDLQSSDRFAALLRAEGVEPETKAGKNGPIYSFAKSDAFLKGLLEHENERVAELAGARLGVKSTIAQTRAERMGWSASRGPLPVYLNYCGAHTTRWSGGDKINYQNPPPTLKRCIMAPPGHKLAILDASQIECRILNYVAGQHDVLDRFRNNEDPYVNVAEAFYGRKITKKDNPDERQVGKVLELQCGFGSGSQKIRETLRIRAGILLSDSDALRARDAYRDTHPRVVDYWKEAELNLKRMNSLLSFEWGPLEVRCDIQSETRRIILPNGCPLIYDTLQFYEDPETQDRYWRIKTRKGYAKLYGAKLVENVVQAMARVVVSQAMNRITAAGIKIATTTHDDIVACLPDDEMLHNRYNFMRECMTASPGWLPGIPLDCEGHISDRYEK